ncbi:MAG: manganese catalase family protein [Clostridioides sp.]|nr:manganese catalase family protein [Clostridioides sp.]
MRKKNKNNELNRENSKKNLELQAEEILRDTQFQNTQTASEGIVDSTLYYDDMLYNNNIVANFNPFQQLNPKVQYLAPYPEIKVEQPNLYYAEILLDDFAGLTSEFTATNQYLFHAFEFSKVSAELVENWILISEIERGHMQILAMIIELLGGRPVYRGSVSTDADFWNGNFVRYGSSLCEQIMTDIETEKNSITQYREHILRIKDGYIQQMLDRIIRDEEVHLRCFEEALKKYCGKPMY